ncbi:tetratricopeptide repeat protein [Iodidimonas sp. SYSU 1G8]|uniref:tetratricopeptide repeat protein n=1 Tax=Iodidimonas sp. SYSU 1G8 TaxID=3133967 RepID=UPI0031FEA2FC
MPALLIISIAAQFACGLHAVRTNRVSPWLYIIVFVPAIGCAIYVVTQMLPDLLHSRAGRQVAKDITKVVDPQRDLRRRMRNLSVADTIENKRRLAEECLSLEMYDEAAELYEKALTGHYVTDPTLMMGRARALFGQGRYDSVVEVLDDLRAANPDYASADGHLLYARALEEAGHHDLAKMEYAYLVEYFPGEEARARYARLLDRTGDSVKSREMYQKVVDFVSTAPKHYYRAQRDWYDMARQRLREMDLPPGA